jgi:hypothetical protein
LAVRGIPTVNEVPVNWTGVVARRPPIVEAI